jgi:hypothetical protein
LPEDCLKSSSTTDGAKNELGAAFALVNEDNALHCAAHNIQLVVNDVFDSKQAHPPPQCARHREVVRKAHGIVIFINGHRDVHSAFLALVKAKNALAEGDHMYQALVEDVVTRWDSELAMLDRLVYFDDVLLLLYRMIALGIPQDLVLDRFEFDLAFAMTLVLTPFRLFTKFVQHKSVVTLAYVPQLIDELVSALAPGSFTARLQGCAPGVLAEMEAFQACLIDSIRKRFAPMFEAESLALAARMFLSGKDLFTFENFPVTEEILQTVKENILTDFVELLPPTMSDAHKERQKALASSTFDVVRDALAEEPAEADPLSWWPAHPEYTLLHPVVKMLLQIPASSAENERSFSSASFILDQRRTRLDIDNFRREHRIRRALCAGTTPDEKLQRSNDLIERFADSVNAVRAAAPAAAPVR